MPLCMTDLRQRVGALLVGSLLLGPGLSAQAQDVAAGRTKAQAACAVCHGPMGLAMQAGVPHLAGQPQSYLVEQLKNYRSGRRPHEVMGVIAKPLTDAEIEALGLWYASIAVKIDGS